MYVSLGPSSKNITATVHYNALDISDYKAMKSDKLLYSSR